MKRKMLMFIAALAVTTQVFAENPSVDEFINNATAELSTSHAGYFAISSDSEAVTINIWDNISEAGMESIAISKYNELQPTGLHLRVNLLDANNLDKVLGQYYDGVKTIEIQSSEPQEVPQEASAGTATVATYLVDENEQPVIWDQDGIKITAKKIGSENYFGTNVDLLIENDSDRNVTVQARDTSVNGYMVDTLLSADVAPGKKINDSMTIASSDLKSANITTIADIETKFHIYDANTWDDIIDTPFIRLETADAEGFEYKFDDSGNQIYNDNGIEVVVKGLSKDESWYGPSIVVYVSNTSDRNVTVQTRDVSINGFMVSDLFSCDVSAGKHAIDTITFSESELKENDITSIDTTELSFHIYDASTWDTIVDTDPMVINFS